MKFSLALALPTLLGLSTLVSAIPQPVSNPYTLNHLQKRCPPFDPAGTKNIGNGKGTQFIGGQCLSTADCASGCCAKPCGICSGVGASFQAGKQGCGFSSGSVASNTSGTTSSASGVASTSPNANASNGNGKGNTNPNSNNGGDANASKGNGQKTKNNGNSCNGNA